MQTAKLIHAAEGGPADRFHIEHFAPSRPAEPAIEVPEALEAAPFMVRFGDKTFGAGPNETILEAATRQQIVIPCGCAGGMCGTCRIRKLTGDVEMRHNGGISPAEEAGGFILACSSRARSDLTLAP
jgi:ferredoxin